MRTHREEFLNSYDEFFALLQTAADDSTPDSELEDLFDQMVAIARQWQAYPDDAATVEFGSEHAELKSVYLDWADLIRELGFSFEDIYQGFGSTDDFLDIYSEWSVVDADLREVLGQFGQRFQRQALNRNIVAREFAVM